MQRQTPVPTPESRCADVLRQFVEGLKLSVGTGEGDESAEELLDWPELAVTYHTAVGLTGRMIEIDTAGKDDPGKGASPLYRCHHCLGIIKEGDLRQHLIDHTPHSGPPIPTPSVVLAQFVSGGLKMQRISRFENGVNWPV